MRTSFATAFRRRIPSAGSSAASPRRSQRVRQLHLKGVYFQRETKRFYPKGSLAAQAIGYRSRHNG